MMGALDVCVSHMHFSITSAVREGNNYFLVAKCNSHKRLCLSVGASAGPSVRPWDRRFSKNYGQG